MRNTWWVTRPKRSLVSVPLCLSALATGAEGKVWKTTGKERELAFEHGLELAGLKAKGKRRDQGGGGARTYRAWLKSLGLLFMDEDDRLWLTSAGEALVKGEPPLPILRKQVLEYQFPSAYSYKGASAVSSKFKVRPFIFVLQLLRDPRLEGYLSERHEVAKIVITYGTDNSQKTVDSVIEKILAHRRDGDKSLPVDYLESFKSSRGKEPSLDKLFANLSDIANTLANWLGYSQLIQRQDGNWFIVSGAEDEIDEILNEFSSKKLIQGWENEETFQRRYGLKPGQRKDTRRLSQETIITSAEVEKRNIELAMMKIASTRVITEIDNALIKEICELTGSASRTVDKVISKQFPTGCIGTFMHEYAQMAFESRERATEFEKATASIFSEIFGFKVKHIGQQGIRPDIVVSSDEENMAGIIDCKAYKKGYSIGHTHRNTMIEYIELYPEYAIDNNPLSFFAYVVSEYKDTIMFQMKQISDKVKILGLVLTARDIINIADISKDRSHSEIVRILLNKGDKNAS